MAFSITLAGQDITTWSDQLSIDIIDSLGQGSGAGSSQSQGRAGTIQFDTSLGPISNAIGAGQSIPSNPATMSSDTFHRANTSSTLGLSTDGETWNAIFGPSADRSITSNQAQYIGASTTHIDILGARQTTDQTVTVVGQISSASDRIGVILRYQNSNNFYRVSYDGNTLSLVKTVAGSSSTIKSATIGALGTGVNITLVASIVGSTMVASIWLSSGSPPPNPQVSTPDTTFAAGPSGLYAFPATAANAVTFNSFLVTQQVPLLVRQGELVIKDALGRTIWGGFATKYTDITTTKDSIGNTKQNFTTINGVDYEGQLARILVNASYVAKSDIQIIKDVLSTYAPWIKQTFLPTTGVYIFPVKNFRNVSVLQVLQTIAGITGYMIWVDFARAIHYSSPANAQTSPFYLSDHPDFITSFPHNVQEYIIDDNSAINKITFYGGKKPSGDFTQDVSPLANGNNKIFPTAYYPRVTSDGKFHVLVNGVEQVVGFATGSATPANTLKSAGGLADCLINPDAQNVTFDIAPSGGSTVFIRYQYEFPLSVTVTDEASHTFFGDPYLSGYISDTSVFDTATAVQRSKVVLAQQSFGLISLKIDCWQPGLQSGQLVKVLNAVRGLSKTYLVQQVETQPLGAGNFVYHLMLGSWNWNLVDILVKLAQSTASSDQATVETTDTLSILQVQTHANVTTAWVKFAETVGPYYARATPVGDGHDAFPGFATISS